MSEYTPTTDEAFNATLYTWVDWKGVFASEEEAADAWVRMIAAVERAAAEEALLGLASHIEETSKRTDNTFTEHVLARHGAVGMIHEYTAYRKKKEEHDD